MCIYAGANVSVMNDSRAVGVVFFADRASWGTISPAFEDLDEMIAAQEKFLDAVGFGEGSVQ